MINIFDQLHVVGINCKLFNMDFVFFLQCIATQKKKIASSIKFIFDIFNIIFKLYG